MYLAEVDTDSHAVVATCELLDILLDAETMTLDETGIRPTQKLSRIDGDSTVQLASESGEAKPAPIKTDATHPEVETDDPGDSKEQKASIQHATDPVLSLPGQCVHTGVPVQLAGRLVQHLVELLKQAERGDVLVCCIVCLSRLHALEGEPPSELVYHKPGDAGPGSDAEGILELKDESAEAQPGRGAGARGKRLRGCCRMAATDCGCSPTVSAMWSVLRDTLAVRRLVSAAVAVISGGLAGPFWPHLAAALTVLTWVAAGLARPAADLAWICQHSRRPAGGGGLPAQFEDVRWHSVCVHRAPYPGLTLSVHEWRASAIAFVDMVRCLARNRSVHCRHVCMQS